MAVTSLQNEKTAHNRFFTITQWAYIFGIFGHAFLGVRFYFMGVVEMVWFNVIISVPFFFFFFFTNRKGWYNFAFSLAFVELLFHQLAAVYFIGWQSGYQFMLLYLTGLVFFNIYWKNWLRISLLAVILIAFTLFYFFVRGSQVYLLDSGLYDFIYLTNIAGTFVLLALLINYYVQNAIKAENNLEFANKKLSDAYEEVDLQKSELEVRNNFIKKTFGRYLSDEIVESILDTPEGLELGGEKRKVTILMSDIRGFTKISESLMPEDVITILNNYLETMTEIIQKYGGTIDEFIGDAILVIFGAPYSKEDDAERAVACALEMQLEMEKVNIFNKQNNFPELEMGIGINTGEVVVGNIGSDKRSKYGVVGSDVNLTSRIESYTTGGQVLVSEKTFEECEHALIPNNSFEASPKGVKKPMKIYSIVGIEGDYDIQLNYRKDDLLVLDKSIEIKYSVLLEKDTDTQIYEARIIKYSEKNLIINIKQSLELFSNLKVSLNSMGDEAIYGKVVERTNTGDYKINITSSAKFFFTDDKASFVAK